MIIYNTLFKLFQFVNPDDLWQILGFSGINWGNMSVEENDFRKEFRQEVYKYTVHRYYTLLSKKQSDMFNDYHLLSASNEYKLSDDHYNMILWAIQDFYQWSHKLNHPESHFYTRVMKALDVDYEIITTCTHEKRVK